MQPNVLPMGIAALLVRLWRHLSRRRQHQFSVLMALVLLGAFAEVVSLGAVLPFIGVLVAPDRVFRQPIIANFARAFSISSSEQLVLPLTIVFAGAALIAGAIRLLAPILASMCIEERSIRLTRSMLPETAVR
jgi:hypothetical protein